MEYSRLLSFLIVFSSWVFLGFSQSTGGGIGNDPATACLTKLLPCQESLKSTSTTPAPTCCEPLQTMIKTDTQCLCGMYYNAVLLKNLNITQADLLKLPKECGIKIDMTQCKAPAGPASSPTTAATGTAPATSSDKNSTAGNSTKSSANRLIPFGGPGLIVSFVALILPL